MTTASAPNLPRTPVKPFYFNTSAHLLRITPQKASTLTDFLEALRQCPASTLIVQKSIREGFGLTVTEALWKGKPTIAGAVGGIPNQIIHKLTGHWSIPWTPALIRCVIS